MKKTEVQLSTFNASTFCYTPSQRGTGARVLTKEVLASQDALFNAVKDLAAGLQKINDTLNKLLALLRRLINAYMWVNY